MEKNLKHKTSTVKLNRERRISYIYKEVQEEEVINKCLMQKCGRLFRAKSKYNRICNECKGTETWKMGW